MQKRITLLGSTGSIGRQTLEIVRKHRDKFTIAALSAHSNLQLLKEQAEEFLPQTVAVTGPGGAVAFRQIYTGPAAVLEGPEGLTALASMETDVVVNAVVGAAGLKATVTALQAGIDVGLANKESLVAGGSLVMDLAETHHAALLPVDSEHSAIFQCLEGNRFRGNVDHLLLTASGGPFRGYTKEQMAQVTREQALKHPNWSMGSKVTIDSATLMNKGLEVIEAHWLFHMPPEKIKVVVHPQSIVHSMVAFKDGSVLAQMGLPDMRVPILYALSRPERIESGVGVPDFAALAQLTFEAPDYDAFPCLPLAYEALKRGGTVPAALNAANEVAVARFLEGQLSFNQIPRLIERAIDMVPALGNPTLDDIFATDQEVRERLAEIR